MELRLTFACCNSWAAKREQWEIQRARTSFEMIIAVHIYREPPITRKLSYGRVERCVLRSSEVPGYYALIWKLKERANPSQNDSFASGTRSCRARNMAYDPACGTIYHDWSKTAGERTCLCARCHQVGALLNTSGSRLRTMRHEGVITRSGPLLPLV